MPALAQAQATSVARPPIAPARAGRGPADTVHARAQPDAGRNPLGAQEINAPPAGLGHPRPGRCAGRAHGDGRVLRLAVPTSATALLRSKLSCCARCPSFAGVELDPTRSHGDPASAGMRRTPRHGRAHRARAAARDKRDASQTRWSIDGFQSVKARPEPAQQSAQPVCLPRRHRQPDVADASLMNRLVWVQPSSEEPAWTAGGTYLVARAIRMHVEFRDRVGMFEQQNIIGRDRVHRRAARRVADEFQEPALPARPARQSHTPERHTAANPRTPVTADQRILRRGYNYDRGIDEAGDLDQGLMFVAFNQDVRRQFEAIQALLVEEPIIDHHSRGRGISSRPRVRAGPATGSARAYSPEQIDTRRLPPHSQVDAPRHNAERTKNPYDHQIPQARSGSSRLTAHVRDDPAVLGMISMTYSHEAGGRDRGRLGV